MSKLMCQNSTPVRIKWLGGAWILMCILFGGVGIVHVMDFFTIGGYTPFEMILKTIPFQITIACVWIGVNFLQCKEWARTIMIYFNAFLLGLILCVSLFNIIALISMAGTDTEGSIVVGVIFIVLISCGLAAAFVGTMFYHLRSETVEKAMKGSAQPSRSPTMPSATTHRNQDAP